MSDFNHVALLDFLTPGTRGRCWGDPWRGSEVLSVSPLWSREEGEGDGCVHIEDVYNKQNRVLLAA